MHKMWTDWSAHLTDMEPLTIGREIQLNDWTLNGFVKEISQLDLAVMDFPENSF